MAVKEDCSGHKGDYEYIIETRESSRMEAKWCESELEVKNGNHLVWEPANLGHSIKMCLIISRVSHQKYTVQGPRDMYCS